MQLQFAKQNHHTFDDIRNDIPERTLTTIARLSF